MFRRADLGHSPNVRFTPIAEVTGLLNVGGRDSGRAARLETQPKNPAAWKQLLRSRKVLGQEDAAEADIETLRQVLPEQADAIIAQSGWDE